MPKSKEISLNDDARQFNANLQAEVATQKDCITRYPVMSIAFVGGGFKPCTGSFVWGECPGLVVRKELKINQKLGLQIGGAGRKSERYATLIVDRKPKGNPDSDLIQPHEKTF